MFFLHPKLIKAKKTRLNSNKVVLGNRESYLYLKDKLKPTTFFFLKKTNQ